MGSNNKRSTTEFAQSQKQQNDSVTDPKVTPKRSRFHESSIDRNSSQETI
jgi:hypothetical protein